MFRRYANLRKQLIINNLDRQYLAGLLGISLTSLDRRFAGKYPWTQDEQYRILDLIREPDEKLSYYFPRNGGVTA